MTLQQRLLKRIYKIKNKAIEENNLEILNFVNSFLYAIENDKWNEFMKLMEIIQTTPEAAEIAMISGFLKEGAICLTADQPLKEYSPN